MGDVTAFARWVALLLIAFATILSARALIDIRRDVAAIKNHIETSHD